MKRIEIPELKARFQIADSYDDIKLDKDTLSLIKQLYMNPDDQNAKLALLLRCLHFPTEQMRNKVLHNLTAPVNREQLWLLLQQQEWVYQGPKLRPFPSVVIDRKKYHLPDEQLTYLGTAEFVIATAHLIQFWTSSQAGHDGREHLARFLAVILRPATLNPLKRTADNGDLREPFHSVKSEARYKKFLKLDLATQLLIAQWFNNAVNALLKTFKLLGEGDSDQGAAAAGIFVQDWEQQIIKVAESAVFGNYDNVMARGVHDVLNYIALKRMEEADRQRAA